MDTHGLTLCRSIDGDGGWSLHHPGAPYDESMRGDRFILSVEAMYDSHLENWDRPNHRDYDQAAAALSQGLYLQPAELICTTQKLPFFVCH